MYKAIKQFDANRYAAGFTDTLVEITGEGPVDVVGLDRQYDYEREQFYVMVPVVGKRGKIYYERKYQEERS